MILKKKGKEGLGLRHFDLVVIGGGTSGLRTALFAAGHGHTTALIEPGVLGGTCLNTGCIPTKAMLYASHLYRETDGLKEFGVDVSGVKLNFSKLMGRVNGIVAEGQEHIDKSLVSSKLTLFKAKASFVDKHTVRAGEELITAHTFIICTGAKNIVVPIKGLDAVPYISNETVLSMKTLPASVTLIGGGYISMEFATFFNNLGCSVTVLERAPQVLGMLDDDVVEELLESYAGIKIITNANIMEVSASSKGKTVVYNDVRNPDSKPTSVTSAELFMAIGRSPNTDGLNLEAAGIKKGPRGEIVVNDYLQTSNHSVFAIGDVNGKAMFAHAAKRESQIAIHNAFNRTKQKMYFELVPWAVFTDPCVAGIGLSFKQAAAHKVPLGVLKAPFTRAGRATIIGDTRGFVKVIYEQKNHAIVGVVIIGPQADVIIHEFVALLNSRTPTVDALRKMIHIHPTLSEVVDSLKDVPVDVAQKQ